MSVPNSGAKSTGERTAYERELEARAARLEAALRQIAGTEAGVGVHRPCCATGSAIARAALEER
jgi:hypothetical protein